MVTEKIGIKQSAKGFRDLLSDWAFTVSVPRRGGYFARLSNGDNGECLVNNIT